MSTRRGFFPFDAFHNANIYVKALTSDFMYNKNIIIIVIYKRVIVWACNVFEKIYNVILGVYLIYICMIEYSWALQRIKCHYKD